MNDIVKSALERTFEAEFSIESFENFLKYLFNGFDCGRKHSLNGQLNEAQKQYIRNLIYLGTFTDITNEPIDILVVELTSGKTVEKARNLQRNLIGKYLKNNLDQASSALVAFYSAGSSDWRLSFVKVETKLSDKGVRVDIGTPPKRYSFLVGNELSYTAKAQLYALLNEEDRGKILVSSIQDAFNIEKITENFFEDYKKIFFKIREIVQGQKLSNKHAHEFTQQLLNRVMFLYFISKKRWLRDNPKFMKWFWESYCSAKAAKKVKGDTFYNNWLSVLFLEAFNDKYEERDYFSIEVSKVLTKAPYLNGGLFRENELDRLGVRIQDSLFEEIFAFFERYNFTIKEDLPLDFEVAVDPQMLGYVYESLANVAEEIYDRQDLGIFYTPRIEVDFMCKRSLVEYLHNHFPELEKSKIYEFIFADKEELENNLFDKRTLYRLKEALNDLAVVDPACGSGAFLVGTLNVLVELHKCICRLLNEKVEDFDLKKRVIKRNLYGVDVMPWAVHSAELRLWLQLIIESDIQPEELKGYPLLPNLNMNLRVGDSLVQEIGGINLNLRDVTVSEKIKSKLNNLKTEKQNFFENVKSREFKDEESLKREETRIFGEIIDERIVWNYDKIQILEKKLVELKKTIQTNLFGEKNTDNYEKEKSKISEKIESLRARNKELALAQKELNKPEKKPFVWEIDFAEIFGEKGGFDIVIGNPPYVRQEMISPPNRIKSEVTLEDRKAYKEKLIKSVQVQFPVVKSFDKKSDYYIYFYFHGLSLLNEKGTFTFITSNSWLDVGYGKNLQEFLCKDVPVIAIYDNPKRSFAHADINTIIALFGAPQISERRIGGVKITGNNGWPMLDYTAKFVMFKKSFEEVLSTVNLVEIDNVRVRAKGEDITELVKNVVNTDDYRIFPITQDDLLEDGWEYPEDYEKKNERFKAGSYEGNKWGGKYLRAPDIFYTILQKGKGRLIGLKHISKIEFGAHTNLDEFFIINAEKKKLFGLEDDFLERIIGSAKDVKRPLIRTSDISTYLFVCRKSKSELKNTKALQYILWGEKQQSKQRQQRSEGIYYNKIPSLRNNKPEWYSLKTKESRETNLFFLYAWSYYQKCPYCPRKIVSNTAFHRIFPRDFINAEVLAAVLNSTLTPLQVFILGRTNLGQGVLKFEKSDLEKYFLIIDMGRIKKNSIEGIKHAFEKMREREFLNLIEECGFDPAKPIREQEPNPLPDRAELDKIIFDELDLTAEERKEVYWSVCEMVKQRLNKAKSVKEKQ